VPFLSYSVFRRKWQILTHPTCICRPRRGWSRSIFAVIFGVRKLVSGLSCGIICVILHLANLIQYRSVTARHTHMTTAYTVLSIASRGKNLNSLNWSHNVIELCHKWLSTSNWIIKLYWAFKGFGFRKIMDLLIPFVICSQTCNLKCWHFSHISRHKKNLINWVLEFVIPMRHYDSMLLANALYPCVHLYVCHKPIFYQNS